MTISQHIAKHFREVYFGGNWTWSNLKDQLSDVTWQQAITKVDNFNTIAVLVFHINYFVSVVIPVLKGEALNASDKLSFDHPPINSKGDWDKMLEKVWADGNEFTSLLEQFPDDKLEHDFTDKKYQDYYRNFHGIIEHTHYHLGQIAILKKLVQKPQ